MSDVTKPRAPSPKNSASAGRRRKVSDPVPTAALKGCGIGLCALFLLLVLFAGIAAGCSDPGILYLPFSLCSLYLGAVTAGFSSARMSGVPFLSGLASGGGYGASVFLLSLFPLPASGLPSSVYWILLLTVIPAALLGSVMGQKKKGKPVYRR